MPKKNLLANLFVRSICDRPFYKLPIYQFSLTFIQPLPSYWGSKKKLHFPKKKKPHCPAQKKKKAVLGNLNTNPCANFQNDPKCGFLLIRRKHIQPRIWYSIGKGQTSQCLLGSLSLRGIASDVAIARVSFYNEMTLGTHV